MPKASGSLKAWAGLLIGGPVLLTLFQNCAQMFETPVIDMGGEASLSSTTLFSGGCEADLMNLYNQTYHPFLKQACASCHTNGPGIGQFGHPDFNTSYNAFKSLGRMAVDRNIVNAAHQQPFTGPHHQPTLDAFVSKWAPAEAAYGICTGNVVAGSGIVSLGKTNPAILAAAANPNTWTRVTWDLWTEIRETTHRNKIPLTVGIDVRVATVNNVRRGYEFRNPTVRINAGYTGPFRVITLRLYINNTYQSRITTYSNLDVAVNSMTDLNISPNTAFALAAMSPIANTDSFGIEFSDIKNATGGSIVSPGTSAPVPTLPATVTLAQLLSNDATLGIFRQSCTGCHNAGNAQGGLDITNAAQARALSRDIYSRMTNVLNPMPRSGLLLFEKTELVRVWRDTGAN